MPLPRLRRARHWLDRDAPIPWPLGKRAEGKGRSLIVVDEELARAISSESALAIKHHWGIGTKMVWKWRKAFAIGRTGTEGSRRLHQAVNPARIEAMRNKDWSEEERQVKRRIAVKGNFSVRLEPGFHGPLWTVEELALLGTDADEVIAARIGKSESAVRKQRWKRKIPAKR